MLLLVLISLHFTGLSRIAHTNSFLLHQPILQNPFASFIYRSFMPNNTRQCTVTQPVLLSFVHLSFVPFTEVIAYFAFANLSV